MVGGLLRLVERFVGNEEEAKTRREEEKRRR